MAGHLLLVHGNEVGKVSFETDRAKFIGRGGSLASPAALKDPSPLSNSEGSVLDPIASIRRTVRLEPKESATVTLVSGIAPTREEAPGSSKNIRITRSPTACFELAWTHGLIMLRHLNATEAEAQLFGRLAERAALSPVRPARAIQSVLARNQRGQRNLWSFGISGDLPIVLLY